MKNPWKIPTGGSLPDHDGKRLRKWFRRRIEAMIRANASSAENLIPGMVDAYDNDRLRYIKWADDEEFRGKNYSDGAWTIQEAAVWKDMADIRARVHVASLAIDSIDQFLVLLDADKLPDATSERPGYRFYKEGSPEFWRFLERRDKAHKTWPILCFQCGEEFRPNRRNARRCEQCRARRGRRQEVAK